MLRLIAARLDCSIQKVIELAVREYIAASPEGALVPKTEQPGKRKAG